MSRPRLNNSLARLMRALFNRPLKVVLPMLNDPSTTKTKSMMLLQTARNEGNVLFNDALNTFYLRLYGVKHMVKDHSDSEKGNMGYSFRLAARFFICIIPQTG